MACRAVVRNRRSRRAAVAGAPLRRRSRPRPLAAQRRMEPDDAAAGCTVCAAGVPLSTRVCRRRHSDAGRRHRREHGGLQRRARRAAQAAAVSRSRSPRPDLGGQPRTQLDARDRRASQFSRLEGTKPVVCGHGLLHRVRYPPARAGRRHADRRRRRSGAATGHDRLVELFRCPRHCSCARSHVPRRRGPSRPLARRHLERCILAPPLRLPTPPSSGERSI